MQVDRVTHRVEEHICVYEKHGVCVCVCVRVRVRVCVHVHFCLVITYIPLGGDVKSSMHHLHHKRFRSRFHVRYNRLLKIDLAS